MRVVFMGTPTFAVPALDALAAAHEIVCVYTQPPRPAGRGQAPRATPVHARAAALGLPVRHPARLRDAAEQAAFAALGADVAVVVAYGLILPQPVLDAPLLGCLNIHASLLPRWRGAAPIQRAVMAGDAETGVCIMRMEASLDTGPILMRATVPIGPEDTAGDLHDRLAGMGARLIAAALCRLPALVPEPQPAAGVTYAAKIAKDEARIDWTRPAAAVARQVRGLAPSPGAWCDARGERLRLLRARVVPSGPGPEGGPQDGPQDGPGEAPGTGVPGQVLGGFTIACGTGAIEVTEAQREGRRPMPAAEVLRGLTLPQVLG